MDLSKVCIIVSHKSVLFKLARTTSNHSHLVDVPENIFTWRRRAVDTPLMLPYETLKYEFPHPDIY
jgi:hypothetical protein